MFVLRMAGCALLSLLAVEPLAAAPSLALGYTEKYPADFSHFEYTDPQAQTGGSLRVPGLGTYDSFNPFLLKSIPPVYLVELVFETLMEQSLDEPFSAYSLLAEDIELAPDGLSVSFRLDPSARFNDGHPVTAADVVYSFETLVGTEAHPRFRSYFRDVKKAEALDKNLVRFLFHNPNRELALVIATGLPIFSPRWAGDEKFSQLTRKPPIASGPYQIGNYRQGSFIQYQRRSDYWAWEKPARRHTYSFESINAEYYFDLNIALEAFKAGEFDVYLEYNSKQWAKAYQGRLFEEGKLVREGIRHRANAGIQGFVFNLRREKFHDRRVRQAISLAYDFHWANRSLFYGQYLRNHSYFSNSELAASGLPDAQELALLEPFLDQLPAAVGAEIEPLADYRQPSDLRAQLIRAQGLLASAGWQVREGRLVDRDDQPMVIDFLLAQTGFERVLMPFAHNLAKLGITLKTRRVDRALYLRRLRDFDYDMIVTGYPATESPGNELYDRFHSSSADVSGALNYAGLQNEVVDTLIDHVVYSEDRAALITASRALDRVLWHQHLMVPNWYTNRHRLAWNSALARPAVLPKYYNPITWVMKTWWWK